MLWPHLFPLYASHIFEASLLRYGVLEIMRNFILTRGRYISEGYFYFLSYYSRAYEKLFSDDPATFTFHCIIEKRTRINYTENLSSRIFIYSSFKAKHNLSVKTQFLRRVLHNFAPFIGSSSP